MRLPVLPVSLLLLGSLTAFAADEDPGGEGKRTKPCRLRTLRGAYGGSFQFLNQDPATAGQPIDDRTHTPGAGITLITFDGRGTWTSRTTLSVSVFLLRLPSSGTYVVNQDCTGTREANSGDLPISVEFVIVDQGQEVFELSTRPGDVALVRLKKR